MADAMGFLFIMSFPSLKAKARKGPQVFFSPPFQRWAIRKFWFNLFFYSPTVETVCCITIHDHYIISNLRINVLAVFYLAHRFNDGRLGNPGLIYFFIHPRLKPRAVKQ